MTGPASKAMPLEDLERAYEALAQAFDRAGAANESVFLATLALVLADRLGSIEPFTEALEMALKDLPPPAEDVQAR